eukprot:g47549.t1
MWVLADFCLVPLGVGVSLSRYVAVCEKILVEAGLKVQLHAFGTNIEGEWGQVLQAVEKCHQAVHELGAPRISTYLTLATRTDRHQTLQDKVASVQRQAAVSFASQAAAAPHAMQAPAAATSTAPAESEVGSSQREQKKRASAKQMPETRSSPVEQPSSATTGIAAKRAKNAHSTAKKANQWSQGAPKVVAAEQDQAAASQDDPEAAAEAQAAKDPAAGEGEEQKGENTADGKQQGGKGRGRGRRSRGRKGEAKGKGGKGEGDKGDGDKEEGGKTEGGKTGGKAEGEKEEGDKEVGGKGEGGKKEGGKGEEGKGEGGNGEGREGGQGERGKKEGGKGERKATKGESQGGKGGKRGKGGKGGKGEVDGAEGEENNAGGKGEVGKGDEAKSEGKGPDKGKSGKGEGSKTGGKSQGKGGGGKGGSGGKGPQGNEGDRRDGKDGNDLSSTSTQAVSSASNFTAASTPATTPSSSSSPESSSYPSPPSSSEGTASEADSQEAQSAAKKKKRRPKRKKEDNGDLESSVPVLSSSSMLESPELRRAVERADLNQVRILVEQGHRDIRCLHKIAEGSANGEAAVAIAQTLLQVLAVDAKDSQQTTALMVAAHHGQTAIVKEFLRAGASVSHTDHMGENAFHKAARTGQVGVLRALLEALPTGPTAELERKQSVDKPNLKFQTPLHLAIYQGDMAALQVLVEEGKARLEATNAKHTETALHHAAFSGHLEIVKYLVETLRVDAKALDETKKSALHYAALGLSFVVAEYLLGLGQLPVGTADSLGYTPLHLLATSSVTNAEQLPFKSDEKTAACLLDAKAALDVPSKPPNGRPETALLIASRGKKYKLVRLLLGRGAALEPGVVQLTAHDPMLRLLTDTCLVCFKAPAKLPSGTPAPLIKCPCQKRHYCSAACQQQDMTNGHQSTCKQKADKQSKNRAR